MDDQVLAHHGIKGQKWGVRRFQNEDGTRTAAGKKRYSENDGESQKKGLSDRQKTAIKVGAAVAITALATYGAYKLNKTGKFDGLKKSGKEAVNKVMKSVSKTKVSEINVKDLSDDELKKQIARMSLERQYQKMTAKESTAQKAMKVAGSIAAATSTGLTIYNNAERIKKIATDRTKKKKDTK